MKIADLHIHTTASDGKYVPSDIVDLAVNKKISLIAITDHDTIEGIEEALTRSYSYDNITVIPGIELSTLYNNNEVHLLGYFINHKNDKIIKLTNDIKSYRYERAKKIVSKLQKLNINISIEEVVEESKDENIGRPHIARVLIDKGYVKNISEAFEQYIGKGKKAYVDRYKLSLNEGIDIIHQCNGIAVIAHPVLLNIDVAEILEKFNLDGIEVYHSKHTEEDSKKYLSIANDNKIYVTGGSDFHGDKSNDAPNIGDSYIDIDSLKDLLDKYSIRVV